MKSVCTYLALLLLLSVAGCSRVEDGGADGSGGNLCLEISRAMDPDVPVRLIIADALKGEILFNQRGLDLSDSYTVNVPSGQLNVYAVVREPARIVPQLDAVKYASEIEPLTVLFEDIRNIVPRPHHTPGRTNYPAVAIADVRVRPQAGDPTRGEVSADGGTTWKSSLDLSLQRLAARITLGIRKETPVDTDIVDVDRAQLIRIPLYGYLKPQDYTDPDYEVVEVFNDPYGIHFSTNSPKESYEGVFENQIVTEYLPPDPSREDQALAIQLFALYNGKRVLYTIPVRGDADVGNYSVLRNSHYVIRGTIKSKGEIVYMPEVGYRVLDWQESHTGIQFVKDEVIGFAARWTDGTNVNGQEVRVGGNEYVEYNFKLTVPKGATWTATLTNPHDFEFDYSDGAVSNGYSDGLTEYKIRIRPIRETSRNDVKTRFYITVRNGYRNVEINLPNPSEPVGTGAHRFTIIQIPT